MSRFIDKFKVLLLDMGNTFMFNGDRFNENIDFELSYRKAGGTLLNGDEVFNISVTIFKKMLSDSMDPANYDAFHSVASYLRCHAISNKLPFEEAQVIEKVIAEHEIGIIPQNYVEVLKHLRQTHRLGIISDIWSRSDIYFQELMRIGIDDLFDTIVFSSDIGAIKPGEKIFRQALKKFDGVDTSKIVYIGDSLRRDVGGAKNVGISAIWIKSDTSISQPDGLKPDLIISDLEEITACSGHA